MRAPADVVRGIDAGESRHVDVEEADVGMTLVEQPHRLPSVPRLGDNLELGPHDRQFAPQRIAQQRFVVRDQRGRVGIHMLGRHVDFDDGAARIVRGEAQVRRLAEDQLQPFAQRRQPGPETVRRLTKSGAGVGDADHTAFTMSCDVDVDPAAFFAGVDPVPDGILDQRQQGGRRTANLQRRRVDVDRVVEAIGHAHLHQLEIRPNQLQLALDRCRGLVEQRHRRAQVRREAAQHGRRMRRARIDERLHVRERVEEEMRRDLRLQQMEARVERLPLELAALEREGQLLIARKRFLLPDDRDKRRPRREEEAGERQVRPPAVLPERRRTLGSGQHVDQHRRHRHEHADRNDLQRPSLEPPRQAPWPHLEECEGRRRRQADDDGAEEERG